MKSKYLPEPKSDAVRVGIKVKWLYFKDEDAALAAVDIAKHNARVAWEEGYDFGYCQPGNMEYIDKGEHAGTYMVCFP